HGQGARQVCSSGEQKTKNMPLSPAKDTSSAQKNQGQIGINTKFLQLMTRLRTNKDPEDQMEIPSRSSTPVQKVRPHPHPSP
ncbi:hypothetical protein TNCT_336241, partial [Trichonephila clavata]